MSLRLDVRVTRLHEDAALAGGVFVRVAREHDVPFHSPRRAPGVLDEPILLVLVPGREGSLGRGAKRRVSVNYLLLMRGGA